jgi:hypothetical protein
MSLIKKADVKNHLSARHRSGIHLTRPEDQSDATGFAHADSTGEVPKANDSAGNLSNIPAPSGTDAASKVTSKSVIE